MTGRLGTTEQRPNVVIIVMDAVRAENMSVLGYAKPTTPSLERHIRDLALYPHYISAATWTLPSTTSLFTGTFPSTHRLVLDGDRLTADLESLPEILNRLGYATAISAGQVPYVSSFTGLDRGISMAYEPPPSLARRVARRLRQAQRSEVRREGVDLGLQLTAEAEMMRRNSLSNRLKFWVSGFSDSGARSCFASSRRFWREYSDRPRFLYVHLQETHAEYQPPHRYRNQFIDPQLRYRDFASINQRPNPHAAGLVQMSEEDYEILTGLYDGCIAYLDEQIGSFVDFLKGDDDYDNTLIIVTSDHGDCIGRHGVLGHQFVCYDELIRIPFVVKWPKHVNLTGVQSTLAQNVDVLPTISALLEHDPPPQCEGENILSSERRVAMAELIKPFGQSAIRQGLHRLAPQYHRAVLAARTRTHKLITYSNDQRDEFYDVANDPRESVNLFDRAMPTRKDDTELKILSDALGQRKDSWREASEWVDKQVHGGGTVELEAEVEQRLRALGYID